MFPFTDALSRIMTTPVSHRRKLRLIRAALVLGIAPNTWAPWRRTAAQEFTESAEEYLPGVPGEKGRVRISGRFFTEEVTYVSKGGLAIVEGDIVIGTVEQIESEIQPVSIAREGGRWPLGIVPFQADPAVAAMVQQAITDWENQSPIRFVQRTPANQGRFPNFVQFVAAAPGAGCASSIGIQGGRQDIILAPGCSVGNVRHEIGHAIGLWHEQSREDRDRWVRILSDNIEEGKEDEFDQHISDGDDVGPYDWSSIMHYPERAFGKPDPANPGNNLITIETIPPGEPIGQRSKLSDGDRRAVRFLYPLAGSWQWTADTQIQDQQTKAAPALAVLGEQLHLLHLGKSSNDIWFSQSGDGEKWSDNKRIKEQKSKAAPAVATFRNQLHLVHLGDESNDIWHSYSRDGKDWSDNKKLDDKKSRATPAVIEYQDVLHMIHIGDTSTDLWYSRSDDGLKWTPDSRIANRKSRATPALAVFKDELHMVYIGEESENMYHSWSPDGRTWSDEEVLLRGQLSRAAPALAVMFGELHLVHIGESSSNVWYSRSDDGRKWSENVRIPGIESRTPLALATLGDQVHMVHKGESSENIWHSTLMYVP